MNTEFSRYTNRGEKILGLLMIVKMRKLGLLTYSLCTNKTLSY